MTLTSDWIGLLRAVILLAVFVYCAWALYLEVPPRLDELMDRA